MSDAIETGTGLATIETADLATIFKLGGVESIVARIEREAREQAAALDASTVSGREARNSLGYKVARSKTAIDNAGKSLNESKRAEINAVDAERREARDRLDALKAEIVAPVEAYRAQERDRVAEHETLLAAIFESPGYGQNETIAELQLRLDYLRNYPARNWQEFTARANAALQAEIDRTVLLIGAAVKREADILAAAEQAERDRLAAIEAQRVREEQIATEAAEGARLAAEAEAERKRVEDAAAAMALLDAAETREREKAEELRTTEARLEAIRIENHKDALARIRLLTNHVSDLPIHDIDDRLEKVEVLCQREWEEFAEEAQTTADATCDFLVARRATEVERLEGMRIAAHESALSDFTFLIGSVAGEPGSAEVTQSIAQLQRLHANRDWEEFTERAAKERADTMATFQSKFQSAKAREKRAADELAEAQQKATIEAERQRVAREAAAQKTDDERRAANRTHRMAINREAMADVIKAMGAVEGGSPEEAEVYGRAIITAIAKGEVRHIAINYAGVAEKTGALL